MRCISFFFMAVPPRSRVGVLSRAERVPDPQAAQVKPAECDDLRPPVWIRSVRAPFSPLWLLLPCSRKKATSVLLAPTCLHSKFPTATASADPLAASRRTNSRLGQIVHSCISRSPVALSKPHQPRAVWTAPRPGSQFVTRVIQSHNATTRRQIEVRELPGRGVRINFWQQKTSP